VADDDNDQETGFHLSLMQRLRAYLFAGILITAPISITVYLSWLVVHFVDERVNNLLPRDYNPNHYLPFSVPGLGLLIVLLVLIFIGGLAAGLIGRAFVRISEGVLHRTPVVRSIYSAIKQIFHTILAERAQAFRQVVLVEFPRPGLWRIGFVTGVTPGKTQEVVPGGLVNVFIPGTPNPTAGFLVLVPKDEAIELELTAEEAIKLIVSGGIATPPPRTAVPSEEPPR
jgi:uncharacterized membrane protein